MLSIELTTPWDPGSADTGTYPRCMILEVFHRRNLSNISFHTSCGDVVAGKPVPGVASRFTEHEISGADYDTILAAVSAAASEVYLDELDRQLLQWCIDNEGSAYAGTIN